MPSETDTNLEELESRAMGTCLEMPLVHSSMYIYCSAVVFRGNIEVESLGACGLH